MNIDEFCLAAWRGNLEEVKEMLSGGIVDVDEKDRYGFTALIWASWNGHNELVKYLLANGANINEKDNDGNIALIGVSQYGRIEVVKYLLENGANINEKNIDGNTALILASWNGHIEIAKYLLENGANPTIRTKEDDLYIPNMTARDIATRVKEKEIVSLLENGERFVFFISFVRPTELFGLLE